MKILYVVVLGLATDRCNWIKQFNSTIILQWTFFISCLCRHYKVNLVALSANPEYSDSGKSNTLSVNTSLYSPREGEALDEITYDDHDIPVKVTKVSETSIHLDWSNFLETEGVGCYKITWSSVAQPAVRLCSLLSIKILMQLAQHKVCVQMSFKICESF